MALVQNFPFLSIILTLSGGVICSVLKGHGARKYSTFILCTVLIGSLLTLAHVLSTGEAYVYMMGHFPAPWGNEIRVGVLETMMAALFSGIMLLSLMGGMHHIFEDTEDTKSNLYFTLVMLLSASLLALVYTNDLFTGYVFVEINTIASCALVMIRYRSGKALVATVRYLFMSLLGSGLFLIGITILYDITGHLLMENIAESVAVLFKTGTYTFPLSVVIVLFSMGLAIKSACFPFHTWLPGAHGNATVSSSSILSGLVLKGYIFLLIKIFYRVIGMEIIFQQRATNVLFIFGVLAMIVGSIKAIQEKDLKRMLAYSSVAQIGYIFLGIGLGTEAGIAAACLHIIVHAITKPMLFTACGGFMDVSGGSKKFSELQGAGLRDKLSGFAFIVGAMSMIGIPFFAGFISKVYLTTSAIETLSLKTVIALAALAISTLLNACYYIPAMLVLFTHPKKGAVSVHPRPKAMSLSLWMFIGLNFLMGCFSQPIVNAVIQGIAMFR